MAGGAAGQRQKMRDFVSRLFQGSPDLSILTHAIIRKKYLDHVGLENLSKQEKEQLKQLVEEELVHMKVDQPPGNLELRTEAQDSFKSGDRKRSLRLSHSSEDEFKNEQEQKRQKIEKMLEVSSDEKDSRIDSKKRPHHGSPKLLGMFSDSSDQGDSGAGNHSDESESDKKTNPSLQEARRERGQGRKSPKSQRIRGLQKRGVSESEETTTDTGQSDLEEEVKEHRKVTKGNSMKRRDFKKKVDTKSKANDPKGQSKNRTMGKPGKEKRLSEEGTDLSVEEISEKKRERSESEESFSTNKAQERMRPATQKGSKGDESEDASGSGPDKKMNLQKKMADSQCRRKSRVLEDLGSSSEDLASQSPVRKEGVKRARGQRGSQQTGNHSKSKRQFKERKKMQREDLHRKKPEELKIGIEESTSEESESESEEQKSSEEEKKWMQDPTSSEEESQSETNQGQPRKAALISPPSESESDESEDGDPRRTLVKESKHVSGCDSSQGEEKLKKRGAQSERNQGQPRKAAALISLPSESESDESEDGGPRRTLEKKNKHVSGCDSSQGEEKLKRGAQSERKQGQLRKAALVSLPSESESDESNDSDPRRTLEKKSTPVSGCDSSQGEERSKKRGAQNETDQGQPRKAALISPPSESESDESENGDLRRSLEKESKQVFGSDSSQEKEKLKKRGAQKSQRKSISKEVSMFGSEDSGSEFEGKKKIQSQQPRGIKKLQRRSATKEKQGEESSQEECSSSEEDEPTTSQQHHLGKDKKHPSGKNEEHPSIQRLKRYIWECGVRRNYKRLLAGCRSRKAQIEVLKEELGSLGIKGMPSLAKCRALKKKREEAAEVASLDINNIIATEGRPKRRKVWSLYNKPQESPSSPEEPTVRRHTTDWSQLRGVISSDGESG